MTEKRCFPDDYRHYIVRVGALYVTDYSTFPATERRASIERKTAHIFDDKETANSVACDCGGIVVKVG